MTAPLAICAPLVYGGVSWMYRSATTLAETTTALALAATGTPPLTVIVTLTDLPSGWTESMVPTCRPSIRTVDPGYTPMAWLKYAVICLDGGPDVTTSATEMIAITTAIAASTVILARVVAGISRWRRLSSITDHPPVSGARIRSTAPWPAASTTSAPGRTGRRRTSGRCRERCRAASSTGRPATAPW